VNVVISKVTVPPIEQPAFVAEVTAAHDALKSTPGFRWAMVLRSQDDPSRLAAVAMWLNLNAAGEGAFEVHRYEVSTARGTMTPAVVAAIVEWRVEAESAATFVSRWNAAYHAIEERLGSRLLKDLDDASHYAGFHVAAGAEHLTEAVLSAANAEAGPGASHIKVERFQVLHLSEA
jgi:heme-degrading monooxygenase HmoA